MAHFASPGTGLNRAFPTLTQREQDVLHLLAAGQRQRSDRPSRSCISLKTVRNNVSNIFTKLQVSDRSAAIVKARDAGFGGASAR